jgi:hypothetical protein
MGKCVVCGKEFSYSVGRVCLDCFQKVGSEVCCICGKKVDVNVAKEFWAYGLTERYGVVDAKGMYEEQGAECPGAVIWQLSMGAVLVFYASGRVELENRTGTKLVLHEDGMVRLVNQSGSEIAVSASGEIRVDARGRRIDLNP